MKTIVTKKIEAQPLRKRRFQRGQGMIEYVLIVCLIAVATVGLVSGVSKQLQASFRRVGKALGATVGNTNQAAENMDQWKDPSKNGDADLEMSDIFEGDAAQGQSGKR